MLGQLERALSDGTVAAAVMLIVAAEIVLFVLTGRQRLAFAVAPGFGLAAALLAAQRHAGAWFVGLALLVALVPHAGVLARGWRQ